MAEEPPHTTAIAAAAAPGGGGGGGGLILSNNESIRSFLLYASEDQQHLTLSLRQLCTALSSDASVPYRSIRSIWSALPAGNRPPLRRLFSGSDFLFASPKPREKSKELKERLRKLAEMEERREYAELVKDITPKEAPEPFSTYKDQMGFGLHVALMMFTGYLVGYFAFRALFDHSTVMNVAGGILGLVCGMLLETVLFIIRTDRGMVSSGSNSKLKKQ